MDITPLVRSGTKVIRGYTRNKFFIGNTDYSGAIVVYADKVLEWDIRKKIDKDSFYFLDSLPEFELLLVGTGGDFVQPSFDLVQGISKKISVEFMSTSAACRTYSALVIEGRKVVASLLPL